MHRARDTKAFRFISILFNTLFLVIHSMLLIYFATHGVRLMVGFNIASVLLYAGLYVLIYYKHLTVYTLIGSLEVMAHGIAATLCLGWDTGFCLYCFGLITVVHYVHYVYNSGKLSKFITVFTSLFSALVFFVLRGITWKWETGELSVNYILTPQQMHGFFVFNSIIVFSIIVFVMTQFTANASKSQHDLQSQADSDELTRMYNRHKMRDVLDNVQQNSGKKLSQWATAILDIDDFKHINDTYGHEAGDFVLKNMAEIMKNVASSMDPSRITVGRWGGEEFLVVQEIKTSENGLEKILVTLNRMKDAICNYDFNYNQKHIRITITVGCCVNENDMSIAATIRKADDRLYYGKNHGKNQIVSVG